MVIIIECSEGTWEAIEGKSAAEKGSAVTIVHRTHGVVGMGEVLGFKRDNGASRRLCRFAANTEN